MPTCFIGEIRIFAGTFAPMGWAFCDGALLSINENQALFTLLSNYYGGDGQTTFGLPNLIGRLPVGAGAGPGLTPRQITEQFGEPHVALTPLQNPAHSHQPNASSATADSITPDPSRMLAATAPDVLVYPDTSQHSGIFNTYSNEQISKSGNGQPHENRMPTLQVYHIICLEGIYPSAN